LLEATHPPAGILGLTGLKGFLLYLAVHFVTSLVLAVKMGLNVKEYLLPTQSIVSFAVDGITSQGLR
jgi:hypothetical protein